MKLAIQLLAIIIISVIIGWELRGFNHVVITEVTRCGKLRSVKYIQNGKEITVNKITEQEYLNLIYK